MTKRTLENLPHKFFDLGRVSGVVKCGISNDWASLKPWSLFGEPLPFIGFRRSQYKELKSLYILMGPFMVAVSYVTS